MSSSRRRTYRYTMRTGNKIEYFGVTEDPAHRAQRHRREGMPGKMRVEGSRVTPETAQAWEREKIHKCRKRNGLSSLVNRTGLRAPQYRNYNSEGAWT